MSDQSSLIILDGDELINRVLTGLENLIDENKVKVIVGSIPEIYGNEANVERVLINLIQNALMYSCDYERPRVEISAGEDSENVTIAVRDFGPGIAPADQEKILFSSRTNPHNNSKKDLGLAVCNKLVQEWGGQLWVESEFGMGSSFFFTVPNRPVRKPSAQGSYRSDNNFTSRPLS